MMLKISTMVLPCQIVASAKQIPVGLQLDLSLGHEGND